MCYEPGRGDFTQQKSAQADQKTDLYAEGGFERIRTAVKGFADLCLATRPRNPTIRTPPKIAKKLDFFEQALPRSEGVTSPVKIGPFIWGRIFLGRCEIKIILGSRKK